MKKFWESILAFFRSLSTAPTPTVDPLPVPQPVVPDPKAASGPYHAPLRPVVLNRNNGWIPWAVDFFPRMVTKGGYSGGWPRYIVVHYSAGRPGAVEQVMRDGLANAYTYLGIGNGKVFQGHPMHLWGYHCGESKWKGEESLNNKAVGIEVCTPGLLTAHQGKYYAWYDKQFTNPIPESERRYVTEKEYGCPSGWYSKYTPQDEADLIDAIRWIVENDPTKRLTYDDVVGHHEISGRPAPDKPFRKPDPGGCLSMSMPEFRKYLKAIAP